MKEGEEKGREGERRGGKQRDEEREIFLISFCWIRVCDRGEQVKFLLKSKATLPCPLFLLSGKKNMDHVVFL